MKQGFRGFAPEAITFLRDLKENNDREWFQPRRALYEERVRQPLIELISAVHGEMLRFAPSYVGEPAKCVFRIYRDTRFSPDKSPYKTHAAAWMWRNNLDKNASAGFYFHLEPDELAVGGGAYRPDPDVLLTLRQHIAANHEAFRATFSSRRHRNLLGDLLGEAMARAPKGFDPAHPAIDLLKRKGYFFYAPLDPSLALSPKLVREVLTRFELMTPFIEFLNAPLVERNPRGPRRRSRE